MDYFAYQTRRLDTDLHSIDSTDTSPDEETKSSSPLTPTVYIHDQGKSPSRPTFISYPPSFFTPDLTTNKQTTDIISLSPSSSCSSLPPPIVKKTHTAILPSLSLPSPLQLNKKRRFSNPVVSPTPRLHVLLVDDNTINLSILSRLLSIHMADKIEHMELVKSGVKALEVLRCRSFDLILMDIDMPILNGIETTRYIRSSSSEFDILLRNKNVPIVAVTTNDSKEWRQTYVREGMNGCVSKPISPKDLKQTLSVVLDLHLPSHPLTPPE
ncbi:CheY-like protein [Backusella circina FSU 941]|nr:CheY-like protein [Backusella circina FSU 941]